MNDFTTDTFFNGRIKVYQSRTGYRFSIDAVLLAAYADPQPGDRVLDLGTGCGVIPLILAVRFPIIELLGVELQEDLLELARRNVTANDLQNRIRIVPGDFKTLQSRDVGGIVDIVVSNPPYRKIDAGRMNPDSQRAVARHEIEANLSDLMGSVRRTLKKGGKLFVIYPTDRLTDLMVEMRNGGIEPKRIRMVHGLEGAEAKLALVSGTMGGRPGLKVDPPLTIYAAGGSYTEEVASFFEP
jgi:tRNA1Val (adenine37-N6)-methyltransferase